MLTFASIKPKASAQEAFFLFLKFINMSTSKYKHLFFDLDRTLWDFDTNNKATFSEMHEKFHLVARGISDPVTFYTNYQKINFTLWEAYKKQLITKEVLNFKRFYDSLSLYKLDEPELAREMGAYYIAASPRQTILYPGTIEMLDTLHKHYQMHIITNGFEEVQYIKIENSGLGKYFNKIITSERAGFKKPDRRIFEFALNEAEAKVSESIIIGDDPEADIMGAQLIGMDQIWVKHPPLKQNKEKPTYEVGRLSDILKILQA